MKFTVVNDASVLPLDSSWAMWHEDDTGETQSVSPLTWHQEM